MSTSAITCVVIEDEPIAAEVLLDYINQIPILECKGHFTDAIFASQFLQKEKIDLLFLDIHLPKIKGLDFLSMLRNPPEVILTTAYHQYALEGYDYNVIDYLMKPIEFSRFLKAVNKLEKKLTLGQIPLISETNSAHFFNVNKQLVKILTNEIIYIESLKDYSRIHTKTQSIVTKMQIGKLEDLYKDLLRRIHRSYLINEDCIDLYTATHVVIGGVKIPIGRSYKYFLKDNKKQ